MVLADTSVWMDHLRKASPMLRALLEGEQVAIHPFVIGELACGHLKSREEILALLHALPLVLCAQDDEVLFFIEKHALAGTGLRLIDIHLLASCQIAQHRLWTKDRRLNAASKTLALNFDPQAAQSDR